MNRSTLLRRLVEPSPSGRVHDMECACTKRVLLPDGDYLRRFNKSCPKCKGTGRVAKPLSRRESHAIVTYHCKWEKINRRVEQYINSKWPMWL